MFPKCWTLLQRPVLFHSPVPQPEVQGGAGLLTILNHYLTSHDPLKKGLHGRELLQREDRLVSQGGHQGGQRD